MAGFAVAGEDGNHNRQGSEKGASGFLQQLIISLCRQVDVRVT
jgi:hypothetical protein